jgi:hypothetical protein
MGKETANRSTTHDVKTFPRGVRRAADPSASLGKTKERVAIAWKVVAGPEAVENASGPETTFNLTTTLSFVIPSSRLAEASRERNDKACALCNIEGEIEGCPRSRF